MHDLANDRGCFISEGPWGTGRESPHRVLGRKAPAATIPRTTKTMRMIRRSPLDEQPGAGTAQGVCSEECVGRVQHTSSTLRGTVRFDWLVERMESYPGFLGAEAAQGFSSEECVGGS